MPTRTSWVAALEELPPDSRGYRRVLRLHAVPMSGSGSVSGSGSGSGAGTTALCGYEPRTGELRADRPWQTVTASGRCPLCDLQSRRSGAVVDLNAAEARTRSAAPGPTRDDVSRRR